MGTNVNSVEARSVEGHGHEQTCQYEQNLKQILVKKHYDKKRPFGGKFNTCQGDKKWLLDEDWLHLQSVTHVQEAQKW